MPPFVVDRVAEALNDAGKPLRGSRVHMYGVAYKRDVGDIRESPALDIIELLTRRGALLSYSDPFVPHFTHAGRAFDAVDEATALRRSPDCIIVCTDHARFDWAALAASGLPIVDTRNALRAFRGPNIIPLTGPRLVAPAVA
jgi:UDP-N-acetyl-D-glucosamine dehydrogenase